LGGPLTDKTADDAAGITLLFWIICLVTPFHSKKSLWKPPSCHQLSFLTHMSFRILNSALHPCLPLKQSRLHDYFSSVKKRANDDWKEGRKQFPSSSSSPLFAFNYSATERVFFFEVLP
jgi:hypothetical protein